MHALNVSSCQTKSKKKSIDMSVHYGNKGTVKTVAESSFLLICEPVHSNVANGGLWLGKSQNTPSYVMHLQLETSQITFSLSQMYNLKILL